MILRRAIDLAQEQHPRRAPRPEPLRAGAAGAEEAEAGDPDPVAHAAGSARSAKTRAAFEPPKGQGEAGRDRDPRLGKRPRPVEDDFSGELRIHILAERGDPDGAPRSASGGSRPLRR